MNMFKALACHEMSVNSQSDLSFLLRETVSESTGNLVLAGDLQKHYLVTEVLYAYRHLGFLCFGPAARTLLGNHLARMSGLTAVDVEFWLESSCYRLLENFNILRVLVGEPNWELVDQQFFRDFVRRLFCSEISEFDELGLGCWDPELLGLIKSSLSMGLGEAKSKPFQNPTRIQSELSHIPFQVQLAETISDCFAQIDENPLRFFAWRLQAFVAATGAHPVPQVLIRLEESTAEKRSFRLAALLSLFLPHQSPQGHFLLPESPLRLSQIFGIFKRNGVHADFDCTAIRNWLDPQGNTLENELSKTLEEAISLGLLFQIPVTKQVQGFGLTTAGLKIAYPFHSAITQALLKNRPVEEGLPPFSHVEIPSHL